MNGLNKLQAELKAPKNQRNNFGKYNYRSCEDILEAVKPLLVKYNLTMTISDDIVAVADRIYLKATATITDGTESVATVAFAREPLNKKGMDEPQITGTASSYARKYALNGLLLCDDTKDADTNEYQKQTRVAGLATDSQKNVFKQRCEALNQEPTQILKSIGWTGGKMTAEQLIKATMLLNDMEQK